jgi:hypothetical protein
MTDTVVWKGDTHDVSWKVVSGGVPVSLTGSAVRVLAKSLTSGETVLLSNTFSAGIVTHVLDDSLAQGLYDLVIEVTLNGKTVTYPDAKTGPVRLTVRQGPETA